MGKWIKRRIMKRVKRYKEQQDFNPRFETLSKDYEGYIGFDLVTRNLLFVSIYGNTEKMLSFDDINSWQVNTEVEEKYVKTGEKTTEFRQRETAGIIKLMTRKPEIPIIKLDIRPSRIEEWEGNLNVIFGQ
jgi:hypothetical protein